MKGSPLDVVLCSGCGSIIPPEIIHSEIWEEGTPPLYSFECPECGSELVDSEGPPATLRNLLDYDYPWDEVADNVELGLFARAVVRQVNLAHPVLPEENSLRELLGNLLAVIHKDGGHCIQELGWERACKEAEELILKSRQ